MFDFFKNKKSGDGIFILFDIGGTKMRVAVSRDGFEMSEPKVASTPKNFSEGLRMLNKMADEIAGYNAKIKAGSGGFAGILNRDCRTIFRSPHLPLWNGQPLRAELERLLGAPVFLENAAALAGLGEATFGAGEGHGIVAYFTVSTGLGGVRVVGGKIDQKVFGFEPGHQIINIGGIKSEGGGELEGYVSGEAVLRRFGKKAETVSSRAILDELAFYLASGIYNSVLHWSPDIVVLGGPMILGKNPIDVKRVELELDKLLKIFPEPPFVKKAVLGDKGGLYGALKLASDYVS